MVKQKTACFVTERDQAENNFISISIVETCPIVINIFGQIKYFSTDKDHFNSISQGIIATGTCIKPSYTICHNYFVNISESSYSFK